MSFGNLRSVIHAVANALHVCRDCGGLYGKCFVQNEPVDQLCRCRRSDEPRWPGFDFNESLTLCYCCGLVSLRSGSRWADWFCDPCKKVVISLNDICGAYVIPIGRHTIHGCHWQSELCVHAGQPDIDAFVHSLDDWNDRISRVLVHAQQAVQANCEIAGHSSANPLLSEYLAAAGDKLLTRSIRIRQLLDRFEVPTSIASRVATDQQN
jgi:hypothetical protein